MCEHFLFKTKKLILFFIEFANCNDRLDDQIWGSENEDEKQDDEEEMDDEIENDGKGSNENEEAHNDLDSNDQNETKKGEDGLDAANGNGI